MPNLEFKEEGHIYLLDGVEIPSVSQLLRFATREIYGEAPKEAVSAAADKGKRVHKALEEYDKTGCCVVDSDIAGFVSAYKDFCSKNAIVWTDIEQPVHFSLMLKDFLNTEEKTFIPTEDDLFHLETATFRDFAGTIDRFGFMNDRLMLIDFKTNKSISKQHRLIYFAQLYLYRLALYHSINEPNLPEYAILNLHEDGTYKLITPTPRETLQACKLAMACSCLHNFLTPKKRKKKEVKANG